MKNKIIVTGVAALIVGIGAGYFGGQALAAPANPTVSARGGFAGGAGGFAGRNQAGGGFLSGAVAAKDAGSITLNTRDGSSRVILLTPDTSVSKSVAGALADIAVGSTIIVSGTTNSDGSVSASLIQLRPAMPSATVGQ